ncbi:O-antigen polysaccharide polymerase Wzy [Aeromonas taiwanensis]|uniref:O-antigen polysaccharide polymerase Wzy n=1 Tax=Aeromonas taiwanensis TaxID=633417 RepID=UPI003F743A9D
MNNSISSLIVSVFLFGIGLVGYAAEEEIVVSIVIMFLYVMSLVRSYFILNRVNVFFLFLISFGFFNLSRIALSLFSNYSWGSGYMYIEYEFNQETKLNTLLSILVFCSAISICLSLKMKINLNEHEKKLRSGSDEIYEKIGAFLMCISFFPVLYRKFLEIKIMSGLPYSEIYVNPEVFSAIPFYLKGWNIIFEYSFYLALVSSTSRKKTIIYILLFIAIGVMSSLNGGRMSLMSGLFIVVTYFSYRYRLRLSLKMFLLSFFAIVFAQFISYTRSFQDASFTLVSSVRDFIIEQGGSLNIIPFNILYKDSYFNNAFLSIFSPLHDGFMTLFSKEQWLWQTETLVQNSLSLSVQLSYAMESSHFLKGFGVGSNVIAEVYNISGLLGIFIFPIVLCAIAFKFDSSSISRAGLFMSIPFVKAIYVSPRGSIFPNFQDIITFSVMLVFFYTVCFMLKSKLNSVEGSAR